jgi:hypothetical protein
VAKLDIKVLRAGAPKKYTFTMHLVGLTRWGRFIFDGEEAVLEIRQPFAVDASREAREVELEFTGNAVHLTLDDEGLRYPITIDPTVDRSVSTGADDVVVYPPSGFFDTSDMIIGNFANIYSFACRFLNITVPQGVSVDNAYIKLTARYTDSGASVLSNVMCEDADDATVITSKAVYDGLSVTSGVPWNNIASWSAEEYSDDTTSPALSTPVGEVIGRAGWVSGNAINVLVKDNGSSAFNSRWAYSYDGSAGKAADLHIEYSEGFINGAAALSADGALTSIAVFAPGLMKSALSADGALTAIGSVGTLHTGAAALSGDGALTAIGVYTALGGANFDGDGGLTAAGVRDRAVTAALSGDGAMTARGEIGGTLEGVASFSGDGALTAVGVRERAAVAAFSGDGALTATAVFAPGLGAAALSADGSMLVIADVGEPITQPMTETTWEIDSADYPAGTTFILVVNCESVGGAWSAYLYNVTTGAAIGASAVSAAAGPTIRVESSAFSLTSGPNVYRVHFGGVAGSTVTPHGAAIRVKAAP